MIDHRKIISYGIHLGFNDAVGYPEWYTKELPRDALIVYDPHADSYSYSHATLE